MMKLKQIVVLVSLCACVGTVPAQQPQPNQQDNVQVQDGIQVRPMWRWRKLASEEQMEQQAALQYSSLMTQAEAKHARAPENHPQLLRLRTIANRIIPNATRWNPEAAKWKWEVNLLASGEVNAFCMPGGRIAFFTGILTKLNLTDDEVAAIMGHEISHALREHGREQAVKSTGTNMAARVLGAGVAAYFGIDPRMTDSVAQGVGHVASLKFSRDDEREADLIGLDLAARAGYDPRAGAVLWQKMGALNKSQPLALLSTHPGGTERIRQINEHMNVLLPLYARAKGTTPERLPPYRTSAIAAR